MLKEELNFLKKESKYMRPGMYSLVDFMDIDNDIYIHVDKDIYGDKFITMYVDSIDYRFEFKSIIKEAIRLCEKNSDFNVLEAVFSFLYYYTLDMYRDKEGMNLDSDGVIEMLYINFTPFINEYEWCEILKLYVPQTPPWEVYNAFIDAERRYECFVYDLFNYYKNPKFYSRPYRSKKEHRMNMLAYEFMPE